VVDIAVNGEEALSRMETTAYSMVFMDCQMPVMDGYAATRAIRENEKDQTGVHVPIVAMTAGAMLGDREKCLAAGMDDYMTKPVKKEWLRSALERWTGGVPKG
jgi:CheY-like chemotaxis protein